jgi:hypothetical protein
MGERQANESDRAASPTALLTTHNTNTYTTVNESTKYAKSLRHFTREALPRLDNYRNILSIQAGHRPTLEELHNATIHDKVRLFIQPQKESREKNTKDFANIFPLRCSSWMRFRSIR